MELWSLVFSRHNFRIPSFCLSPHPPPFFKPLQATLHSHGSCRNSDVVICVSCLSSLSATASSPPSSPFCPHVWVVSVQHVGAVWTEPGHPEHNSCHLRIYAFLHLFPIFCAFFHFPFNWWKIPPSFSHKFGLECAFSVFLWRLSSMSLHGGAPCSSAQSSREPPHPPPGALGSHPPPDR